MAKKVHELPKKLRVPLWANILIICVLLIAACLTTYAAFQHVNNSAKNEGFARTSTAIKKMATRLEAKHGLMNLHLSKIQWGSMK